MYQEVVHNLPIASTHKTPTHHCITPFLIRLSQVIIFLPIHCPHKNETLQGALILHMVSQEKDRENEPQKVSKKRSHGEIPITPQFPSHLIFHLPSRNIRFQQMEEGSNPIDLPDIIISHETHNPTPPPPHPTTPSLSLALSLSLADERHNLLLEKSSYQPK